MLSESPPPEGTKGPLRGGIDLGGTKIESALIDSEGEIIYRTRIRSPRGSYESTLDAIRSLVKDLDERAGYNVSIGCGIPGTVSTSSHLVKNANSTWLIGKPFDRDLTEALGRPVRVANDADCLAVSEAFRPGEPLQGTVFAAVLGTGVGAGIVIEGRLLQGPNGIAGEWGHNPLPRPKPDEIPGPDCYCGRKGCIETFLSGPAMARDHALVNGGDLDAAAIAAKALEGDRDCSATMELYCERLARSLAHVINILDPHWIVLGGGLSNVDMLYERVPQIWGKHVFSDTVDTHLIKPVFGDSSGIRGAAALWSVQELLR